MLLHYANRPLTARLSDISHDVWLCDQRGYRVALLNDHISLGYSLSVRDTGGVTLELPWEMSSLVRDYALLEVWWRVGEQTARPVEVFVVQSRPQGVGNKGTRFLSVTGPTLTGYVVSDKRVVQAVSVPDDLTTSSLAARTGALDDVLKDYVTDTVMAAWDGDSEERDLTQRLNLSLAVDQGQGARERVTATLSTLKSVAGDILARSEQSTAYPTRLYWRVRAIDFDPLRLRFETLARYYGAYRGLTAARPLVLSPALGTIGTMDIEQDRTSEVNSVLVKYNDGTSDRLTRITDTGRARVGPIAFREGFYSAVASTASAAEAEARYRLWQGKPRRMVRATVTPSSFVRYGVDYHLGDVVVVEALGRQWDAEIVAATISAGPPASIQLRLDAWEAL